MRASECLGAAVGRSSVSDDDDAGRGRLRRPAGAALPPPERPSESARSLGLALKARNDEIAETVLERWEAGQADSGPVTERVREDVRRFCRSGTQQITTVSHHGRSSRAPRSP